MLAGAEGALAKGCNEGGGVAVTAVQGLGVNAAYLDAVKADGICVCFCGGLSVCEHGKAKLIF